MPSPPTPQARRLPHRQPCFSVTHMINPLADPLYTPALFTHKFDIDTLITALLGTTPQHLNTTDGSLTSHAPQAPASHSFLLEPLPPSVLTELAQHPLRRQLDDAENQSLTQLLGTCTTAPQLLPHLTATRVGGWLHERLKELALEWLDSHNLVPPSLRHINRKLNATPAKSSPKSATVGPTTVPSAARTIIIHNT
jgi:hypothetical protein